MSQDRVGKPWTKEEDELLIQAVSIHGEVDNWKTVALSVPGRTNKACRKRWLHSLSPSVKKTAWTPDEDQLLLSLYATHGTKWSVIARHISGRTDDACSKRYREALDPTLKKDEWTSEEDRRLLDAYARLGGKWGQVGHELNRSGLACRNRWRMLERRKATLSAKTTSQQPTQLPISNPPQAPESTWIPPLPILDPTQFWDNRPAGYYDPLHYPASSSHEESYVPPHFEPPANTPSASNDIQSGSSSHPPPFQFTSSSLSAALSISTAANNPPGTHLNHDHSVSPTSQHASSLDGEPLQDTPSFSPGPGYDTSEFLSHSQDALLGQEFDHDPIPQFEDYDRPSMNNIDDISVNPPVAPNVREERIEIPAPQNTAVSGETIQEDGQPMSFETTTVVSAPQMSAPEAAAALVEPGTSQDAEPTSLPDPLRHYRTTRETTNKQPAQVRKRPERAGDPPKLSSTLPAGSDPNILAYACGHEDCWPGNASSSSNCFATSQELSEHWKDDHAGAIVNSKPFRCSLAGCGGGWKSLNGLQYHLQISKVHFQQALSATAITSHEAISTPIEDGPPNNQSKKKTFKCPHPNCLHQYRQKSGLRYHLTHGHHDEMPAQLDVVPPTLARKVAQTVQVTVAPE